MTSVEHSILMVKYSSQTMDVGYGKSNLNTHSISHTLSLSKYECLSACNTKSFTKNVFKYEQRPVALYNNTPLNDTLCFFSHSECLDGDVVCFEDFVPDMEGRLNSSQLDQLSDLLKLFFYFEDECTNSIVNDIRVISRRINTTSESELIHHYRYII